MRAPRSLTSETQAMTCYRSACDEPIAVVGRTRPVKGVSRNVEGFCSARCAGYARYRATDENPARVFPYLKKRKVRLMDSIPGTTAKQRPFG